jgi:gamma-glutamyltranspeptidase/glutathione hydrolase
MPASADTYLEEAYLDRTAASLAALGGATPTQVARALDVPLTLDLPTVGDTTHFAIVDAEGLAVSCIQSVYFDFGTGIVPNGSGFALQNRGAGFTLREGHPNVLAPAKRPLHTLAPALATDAAGSLTAVLGAMGGDAQTQIHTQLLLALRSDPDPARATSLPRWFVRPRNDTFELLIERRGRSLTDLEGSGHVISKVAPFDELMGHAQVIIRLPDGTMLGAADPRSDGLAIGR